MEKVNVKRVESQAKEFVIPIGLLKTFKADIRVRPKINHPAGYITFDMQMLISILRDKDVVRARELALELEKLGKAGGELLIMQR